MKFYDEYELGINGLVYYVNVEGTKKIIEDRIINDFESLEVFDELGNLIESDDEVYPDIYEDAINRDYITEIHDYDFDTIDEVEDLML